ncbi:MAG TPA: hypothetical protein IAA05_08740 [Candidatus Blautia excrementipullorum]|nr:hypothetical protein [Candidatus Blautia excrementipullorum]
MIFQEEHRHFSAGVFHYEKENAFGSNAYDCTKKFEKGNVGISREILDICSAVLTKYAPPIAYNELTYQSEGLTGHRGLFLCLERST